ncbi:RNA-directed DNA polymerase [Rhizobium leguminosarum]
MPDFLSSSSIDDAIMHITRYGDTDIFPHLIELGFLAERKDEVVAHIAAYDINNFQPSHSVEALAPKSRYGFRTANQLMFLDCLLFTAGAIEIAEDLEKIKGPVTNLGAFAYRYEKKEAGSIFKESRTYRDWLAAQKQYADEHDFDSTIFTDIADFYQRIYFHRIENLLRSSTSKKHVVRLLENVIKKIRAKQSYGIPVGGTASRLIAEAVLSDFDHSMEAEEYDFSRFVDDIRIYVKDGESPYRALSLVAETLLSEGLTLNAQKTKVLEKQAYLESLAAESDDTFESAEKEALNTLAGLIYFEEHNQEEIAEQIEILKSLNLIDMLEREISEDYWDFGRIRSIFRALRLTNNGECVDYIVNNLEMLLPFIKDIVILLDALKKGGKLDGFDLTDDLISLLASGAGRGVPVIRAWLLEVFVRGISPITAKKLADIAKLSELDGRQLILINGVIKNIVYFRKNKTRFEQFGRFEQYALIVAASCLPADEYETWLGAIKPGLKGPLDTMYCDWAKTKQGGLADVIASISAIFTE